MAHGIKMRSLGRLPPQPAFLWRPKLNAIKIRLLNGVKTILNILDSVCRAVDAPLVALGLPIRNILDSVCRQVADTFVALGPPRVMLSIIIIIYMLGHLCLDTYAWTPMLATATGNRDKDPTLNRFPEMDVYGTVLALKDVENRTAWGPRAGIIYIYIDMYYI